MCSNSHSYRNFILLTDSLMEVTLPLSSICCVLCTIKKYTGAADGNLPQILLKFDRIVYDYLMLCGVLITWLIMVI